MSATYTSFLGHQCIAHGTLADNLGALKALPNPPDQAAPLCFADHTGQVLELDLRPPLEALLAQHLPPSPPCPEDPEAAPTDPAQAGQGPDAGRGRGRPRLGVVPREVTLLPRHWEWLKRQPGGASVVLRRLVEEARRREGEVERKRQQQERAYRAMTTLAGDLPGYEEATRALFAGDPARFDQCIAPWPRDVADYARRLGFGGDDQ